MPDPSAIPSHASGAAEAEATVWSQLFLEHSRSLLNYCLYRVGDLATAEDLAADVFQRAWRARRRYNPRRGEFSTWLFTIARRRMTDWQRRQARRRLVELDEQLPSSLPGPDILTAEADDRRRLRELIQALPVDDQELIALKFGGGMTNRQIACIIGKSETAVGSAIYRLVRKLRVQWEEVR